VRSKAGLKNSAASRAGRVLTTHAVERLARRLVPRYSQRPAGAAVRRKLQALEHNCRFTPQSRRLSEELLGRVGVARTQGISLPISDQPFWFRAGHPLANYQSAPSLPPSVDALIIGAGLTGTALKFLAALNQDLINALRGADQRLLQLSATGRAACVV
jgi:hypothetical protein